MAIKQALQFEQGAGWDEIWSQSKETQAGGTWRVVNQPDGGHGLLANVVHLAPRKVSRGQCRLKTNG
jgi:hypothetical protein